jgi:hypothetical protein
VRPLEDADPHVEGTDLLGFAAVGADLLSTIERVRVIFFSRRAEGLLRVAGALLRRL